MRYLIDAMVTVKAAVPEAKLLIVGHGELEQSLKKQVINLALKMWFSLQEVFPMPNCRHIMPQPISLSDLPFRQKAEILKVLGLTFVEAAMSGCLVIGTKTGGIEDIVTDGKTGLLVPSADAQALAAGIIFSINNIKEKGELIENARVYVRKRFGWENIEKKYLSVLTFK